MEDIRILNQPINFNCASDHLKRSIQALHDALVPKSDPQYGGPVVSVFIHDQNGYTLNLPPNTDDRVSRMSKLLPCEPIFNVHLSCATTKYNESSSVGYTYNTETGVATIKEVEVEKDHGFSAFEGMATKIIEDTCLMILKKAEEEMNILRGWEKILK